MSELLLVGTLVPIVVDGSFEGVRDMVAGQISFVDPECDRGYVYEVHTVAPAVYIAWVGRNGEKDLCAHMNPIVRIVPEPLTIFHKQACEVIET